MDLMKTSGEESSIQAQHSPLPGETLGEFTLVERIARGGNGEVWRASGQKDEQVAIKVLMKVKQIAYQRFRSEVQVTQQVAGVAGILPVLAHNLPEKLSEGRAWYAMPLAVPLATAGSAWSPRMKVLAITQAAYTMAELHRRKIAHRDIKLSNLLFYKERCHICDFGLVDYPGKADLTGNKEQLGPIWTMAPEVRRNGRSADPFPADVYSLAKTLWITLTGHSKGFDGQFMPEGELSIRDVCVDLYITPLETIVKSATDHLPEKRPTMAEFASALSDWAALSKSWEKCNPLQWKEACSKLFPVAVPARATWEDIDEIAIALDVIGHIPSLNHVFFPDGGGLDFDHVVKSQNEAGCIELHFEYAVLVKPLRLQFESFANETQWNYFRLECAELEPSGVYNNYDDQESEELTDLGDGRYVNRSYWDNNSYHGAPLGPDARVLVRYFGGAFVIFQKSSQYNYGGGKLDGYDGRHNRMTSDVFREYIDRYRIAYNTREAKREAEKLSAQETTDA